MLGFINRVDKGVLATTTATASGTSKKQQAY